jgi:hypothetical protein
MMEFNNDHGMCACHCLIVFLLILCDMQKGPEHIIVDMSRSGDDDVICSDNELQVESPPNQSRTPQHPPNGMIRKMPPTSISADNTIIIKNKRSIVQDNQTYRSAEFGLATLTN